MIKVCAYCTLRTAKAVENAMGVEPITSPPFRSDSLPVSEFERQDLIYFRLHGSKEIPGTWFGEDRDRYLIPALDELGLKQMDLGGALVVVANCYGWYSPIMSSIIQAGAGGIIAGPGKNFGAVSERVVGVDKLARGVLLGLKRGMSPSMALRYSKARLLLTMWRPADRDALEFSLIRG
jgi:hypothetical protein